MTAYSMILVSGVIRLSNLKNTTTKTTISTDNTNYTIALKEEEKQNCVN